MGRRRRRWRPVADREAGAVGATDPSTPPYDTVLTPYELGLSPANIKAGFRKAGPSLDSVPLMNLAGIAERAATALRLSGRAAAPASALDLLLAALRAAGDRSRAAGECRALGNDLRHQYPPPAALQGRSRRRRTRDC